MAMKKKRQTSYVQYSKRVTKWALILCTIAFIACLSAITLLAQESHVVQAVVSIYTTYAAVLGVVIGAYQTNSGVEKYQRLKRSLENIAEPEIEIIESDNG